MRFEKTKNLVLKLLHILCAYYLAYPGKFVKGAHNLTLNPSLCLPVGRLSKEREEVLALIVAFF